MSRPFSVVILGLFCIFCFAGCGGGLFLNEEAPVFYTISYDVTSACDALCSHMEQPITIAVWDFDADSPYNKDGMVVKAGEFGISQSARNYWVARPGKILADCLVRDLNEESCFYAAVVQSLNMPAVLNVSGRIEKWVWNRVARGRYRAELTVFMQVWRTKTDKPTSRLLFKKKYIFYHDATNENSAELFASQMSLLVNKLSKQFRRDFCSYLKKGPGHI
ncbi:MAG: hypothetical protein JRI45_07010 [Deltaproteobacteria bacterium]|nr:hypothetical protein [Deltaproteobacteria bacterium]MBW2068674.1 hypothetical protein [Deltaproteobacteria bacterium]